MGTLRATLPDGELAEKRISRHTVYRYGLAAMRGDEWSLVSVHRTAKAASRARARLAGCFKHDGMLERLKVIDVVPVLDQENDHHPQVSTRLNRAASV